MRARRNGAFRRVVLALVLGVQALGPTVSAQDAVFRSSFEALGAAVIDAESRRPVPDSTVATTQDVVVAATYRGAAGAMPKLVRVFVDGVDRTDSAIVGPTALRLVVPAPRDTGPHSVQLQVDGAESAWSFQAIAPPSVTAIAPTGTWFANELPGEVVARFEDVAQPVVAADVRVLLDGRELPDPQVTMDDARRGSVRVALPADMPLGDRALTVIVANAAGAHAEAAGAFRIVPAATYAATVLAPADGSVVRAAGIAWHVGATANLAEATSLEMPNGETYVPIDFSAQPRAFRVPVTLQPGVNPLAATVRFSDGTTRPVTAQYVYDAPPVITSVTPADFASFGPVAGPGGALDLTGVVQRPIAITGQVSRPVVSVHVNQQAAQVAPDGRSFSFPVFFLREGTNLLSIVATDEFGRTGDAQRTVYVDQTAPILSVEFPEPDWVTSNASVRLRGIVNDAVESVVGAGEPVVRIRNITGGTDTGTRVDNRYFASEAVPLVLGVNRLEVVATDQHGNERRRTQIVTRIAAGQPRLTLVAGDGQQAAPNGQLANPLVVLALDAEGLPRVGVPVAFDVTRGSGSIATTATPPPVGNGQLPPRRQVVTTDETGQATVWFTLGNEAGNFAHSVRAQVAGEPEAVVFLADAARGPAAWVLVNGHSGTQYVATGGEPVDALSVVVIDAQRNPIPDMPVRFVLELGDARFTSGGVVLDEGRALRVVTDRNGVASARPTAGADAGVIHVRARAETAQGDFGAADFRLIVLPRQDGPTSFSGVVQDHTGIPLEGIRVSISRTPLSTLTDADGRFRFEADVPPGKIDLHIDGTAVRAVRAGQDLQYPGLHFETAVIAGQDNQLPHAIYLPPINLSAAANVGGDADVRIEVPGFEGFAMTVKANSVTFPDGTREGPMVVTPVHGDRLPMVPPGGFASFGAIAWTIQPTGTRFDPPIEVELPNTAGLRPGETLPIVQWDHDLATFVPMGRGTVAEDGARIVSDPGSGVTKAGWGGGPPPVPPNCGDNPPPSCRGGQCGGCPACQVRGAVAGQQCPSCSPDLTQVGDACDGSWCTRCNSRGSCVPDPARFPTEPPAGVSSITFKDPVVVRFATGNKGEFFGYRNSPVPATWTFEVEPYCTPVGHWKFKVKKAEIEPRIARPTSPSQVEFHLGQLLANGPGANQNQCAYLDSAEFQLHWAASSHYNNGASYNSALNPAIATMQAANMHTVAVPPWDTWAEVLAHETQHFRRFKRYVNQHWPQFQASIERIGLSMQTYRSKADVLASDALRIHLDNAIITLASASIQTTASQGGFGDHAPPDDFYGCSLGALFGDFLMIDGQRTVNACPIPSRSAPACPN